MELIFTAYRQPAVLPEQMKTIYEALFASEVLQLGGWNINPVQIVIPDNAEPALQRTVQEIYALRISVKKNAAKTAAK